MRLSEEKQGFIPLVMGNKERRDQEDVFVSVNERTWLIRRGVEVEVPLCVAEVLRSREMMLETIMAFEDANRAAN